MKIAVVADSNSGITQEEAKELGCYILPMPFTINQKEFKEGIDLSHDEFYKELKNGAEVFTSQPVIGDVTKLYDELLEEYDQIVHIPMSSTLSGSYQTASILAEEDEYKGRVFVVNSQRISITQRRDVVDALLLAEKEKTGQEIFDILTENKFNASIYVTVDTVEYLKKGGRITASAAALAGLLKIKPILTIQGEKIDSYKKTRTMSKAHKIMIDSLINDIKERIDTENEDMRNAHIMIAYAANEEDAYEFKTEVQEYFPHHDIICVPLSLNIACHTGPGALGLATSKKIV